MGRGFEPRLALLVNAMGPQIVTEINCNFSFKINVKKVNVLNKRIKGNFCRKEATP